MFSISRIEQVLQAVPRGAFDRIVQQHQGDRYTKGFGCWQHLLAMVYAQLSGCTSLRQLEAGFNAHPNAHYHLNTRRVRRSTLADANATRSPAVFAQLLQLLLAQAGRSLRRERQELLYLIDSTLVELPYKGPRVNAYVRPGLKLHVLLHEPSGQLAEASITSARVDDKSEARKLDIQRGATYVFDRGYCDYEWWWRLHKGNALFVTRFKRNAALRFERELPCGGEILRDSIVAFAKHIPRGGHRNSYSAPLRRIEVQRADAAPLVLATNDMSSSAEHIAQAYKRRWQIELLFKWVKQHLQIRRFLGTSENAIRIQLLTALIAYVLVQLLKSRTGFAGSMWMLLAQLRHSLFQRPRTEASYWRRRRARLQHIASVQPLLL
jgi:IS4 transposase